MVIACGMLSLGMLASCGNGEKSKTEGMMNVQCFESDMMSAVASADCDVFIRAGNNSCGNNYEAACKDNDFEAAHKILNNLYEEWQKDTWQTEPRRTYYKAFDYVYTAEIEYIFSTLQIDDARTKIMYILQEAPAKNSVSYVNLCKKICAYAMNVENFEFATEVFGTLNNKIRHSYYDELRSFYDCFQFVHKSYAEYIIKNFTGKESVSKIAMMLQGIPVEGDKIHEGAYDRSEVCAGVEIYAEHPYIAWHINYNKLCDHILSFAINNNNKDVAKAIVMLYCDDVERIFPRGDSDMINGVQVGSYEVYLKLTRKSSDEAAKKYKQAVELGLFDDEK